MRVNMSAGGWVRAVTHREHIRGEGVKGRGRGARESWQGPPRRRVGGSAGAAGRPMGPPAACGLRGEGGVRGAEAAGSPGAGRASSAADPPAQQRAGRASSAELESREAAPPHCVHVIGCGRWGGRGAGKGSRWAPAAPAVQPHRLAPPTPSLHTARSAPSFSEPTCDAALGPDVQAAARGGEGEAGDVWLAVLAPHIQHLGGGRGQSERESGGEVGQHAGVAWGARLASASLQRNPASAALPRTK